MVMAIVKTAEGDVKSYQDKISEDEEDVNQCAHLVDAECNLAPFVTIMSELTNVSKTINALVMERIIYNRDFARWKQVGILIQSLRFLADVTNCIPLRNAPKIGRSSLCSGKAHYSNGHPTFGRT
jgi:hypothetical protein